MGFFKRLSCSAFLLLWGQVASSALPPQYQDAKDLDAMVAFVKKNEHVLLTLERIDFSKVSVYYNGGCEARFKRKGFPKFPGWVGPADPLVFYKSTCSLSE